MKVGLIDVDGHNFPNLPLMKISAYHKSRGDSVEWYVPMGSGHMDKVYMSKVFSFTPDYSYHIDADEVIRGGSGYCINMEGSTEVYAKEMDNELPYEIEHIYPDYSLYNITDTAYGFLTRGCPRGCGFCHVATKEGKCSQKVANLSEFWKGQKNIVLCDPNILACKEWKELVQQLVDSKAFVDFNQGLDIRIMTDDRAEMINRVKMKTIHFAWDRYDDKDVIIPKLKLFREHCKLRHRDTIVYTLVNYDTTLEQDLERIYTLRQLGYYAYVMIYNKESLPHGHILRKLQRWVNNRYIFSVCKTFDEYLNYKEEQKWTV